MKKLQVTITLDMDIPDEWIMLEHPDGVPVLDIGDDKYMYMSFLPMFTEELEEQATWTSECSDDLSDEIVGMVLDEDVKMNIVVN